MHWNIADFVQCLWKGKLLFFQLSKSHVRALLKKWSKYATFQIWRLFFTVFCYKCEDKFFLSIWANSGNIDQNWPKNNRVPKVAQNNFVCEFDEFWSNMSSDIAQTRVWRTDGRTDGRTDAHTEKVITIWPDPQGRAIIKGNTVTCDMWV